MAEKDLTALWSVLFYPVCSQCYSVWKV